MSKKKQTNLYLGDERNTLEDVKKKTGLSWSDQVRMLIRLFSDKLIEIVSNPQRGENG